MLKCVALFLFGLLFSFQANAESFVAKVNRNQVPLGETFVLTLQYDGNPATAEPDWSPLKNDFIIRSVGREYQSRNINGKQSRIFQWNIVLSPKVSGTATIPAISFRNLTSTPIQIKTAVQSTSGTVVPKFAIGRSLDNKNPLVQQQIIYTLVIKTTEKVQGAVPQFSDGQDWIIKQIDQPTINTEIDNGIETKKIEIRYAMFPQKSGRLSVPELQFGGYYIDKSNLRSDAFSGVFGGFFDDSMMSGFGINPGLQRIDLVAQPIEVDVRPIPQINNGYWWLPSSKVEISSDWDGKVPEFNAGEAVKRKITIAAAGVADTQLPQIIFPEKKGLKQYPEKPEYKSIAIDEGIVSAMDINVVYIPEQGGQLIIPAIEIPWYNTSTGQMEKAVLPEMEVHVAGNAPSPQKQLQNNMQQTKSRDAETEIAKENNIEKDRMSLQFVLGLIAVAFAAGLLVSWLLLQHHVSADNKEKKPIEKAQQPNVTQAAKSGDVKLLRDSVIAWAKENYPTQNILNLDDVAELFNDEALNAELQKLGQILYSNEQKVFAPKELLKHMQRLTKQTKSGKAKASPLPNLYK